MEGSLPGGAYCLVGLTACRGSLPDGPHYLVVGINASWGSLPMGLTALLAHCPMVGLTSWWWANFVVQCLVMGLTAWWCTQGLVVCSMPGRDHCLFGLTPEMVANMEDLRRCGWSQGDSPGRDPGDETTGG